VTLVLDRSVALVTGGSRGIGLATAKALAEAGASVVIVSRREASLAEAVSHLVEAGVEAERIEAVPANAGDPDAPERVVARVLKRFGALDVLVNNAATNPHFGPLTDVSVSQMDKTYQVNLRGPILWAQAAWRAWMADHGGAIVNVASVGALAAEPGIGFYNATKAALVHVTRQLAVELAPKVRVNAVAPGLVRTEFARGLWEPFGEAVAKATPLGRIGEPDDIAGVIRFLVGPDARWITGQTLVVDGGVLLGARGTQG
jgi:NAD(P)-dependent dehydrogenase (short-subunit alcohol dehydrogenase family)